MLTDWLWYPFVVIFGLWCSHEDGVMVRYEIRGKPAEHKVNVVCEKPDLRIPVWRDDER